MADPFVFPAAATLTGFVMSALGWYGMIRNGIEMVYADMKTIADSDIWIEKSLTQIESQETQIAKWTRDWLITDITPESVYTDYWGKNGHIGIEGKLKNLAEFMRRHRKELQPIIKERAKDGKAKPRRERNDKKSEIKNMQNSIAESFKQLEGSRSRPVRKTKTKATKLDKLTTRLSFHGLKQKYIQKLTDAVATQFSALEAAAKNFWEIEQDHRPGGMIPENWSRAAVYHQALCHMLANIALNAWPWVDDLRASCIAASTDLIMELELDIFGESAPQVGIDSKKTIMLASRTGDGSDEGLNMPFLARKPSGSFDALTQIDIRTIGACGGAAAVSTALLRVLHGADRCVFSGRANYFCALKSTRTRLQNSSRKRIWSDYTRLSAISLSQKSQLRVAFELSQACLLFLDTEWFSHICICHVNCGSTGEGTLPNFEFGLEATMSCMARGGHETVLTAGILGPTRSIRQLFLMLVEVWHLARISSVTRNPFNNQIRITMQNGNGAVTKSAEEILSDSQVPDQYKQALHYCYSGNFESWTARIRERKEEDVREFYKAVVQPLKMLYNRQL